MRVDDFDYDMPEELIALHPPENREASRMMLIGKGDHSIAHHHFSDLTRFLKQGDLLVLNDTKVIPARLYGHRKTGGRVEFLLTEPVQTAGHTYRWRSMVKASKKLKEGEVVLLDEDVEVLIKASEGEGFYLIDFSTAPEKFLNQKGHIPLPPYIAGRREEESQDKERYQTVYAEEDGSCAAPTAGLHFTANILEALGAIGVKIARLTLHVGPGTFLPVRAEDTGSHKMHEEFYRIPEETMQAIQETRQAGGRVIAVGTTSVRALESHARTGLLEGRTDLFITPEDPVVSIDGLITNFHLPKSTLLMLVAAFMGMDLMKDAYKLAVEERYRFYSYGDCMLVL